MALLQLNNVTFAYEGSYDTIFENLSFQADTGWRLGLIGRNGRGKTTLLRILAGDLAAQGSVYRFRSAPVLFPFAVGNPRGTARDVMLGPLRRTNPYGVLTAEAYALGLDDELLSRSFSTLSRGEQTKAAACRAVCTRDDSYPLIDEPTNHLDLEGRETVANYLSKKRGFLLVSHDRSFLNRCITHTLSLNRSTIAVQRGNYDSWEREFQRKNEAEAARNVAAEKGNHRFESHRA